MTTPLAKLRVEILKKKLDGVLISSIPNIIYLTGYSGFSKDEREAFLIVLAQPQRLTHKTSEVHGYILTDGRYAHAVKTLIPNFKLIEISSKNSAEKILKSLVKKYNIKRLGFEGNNLTFLEHKAFSKLLNDLNHLTLGSLRSIKTPKEISLIEKACKLGDKTFKHILKFIKRGVSEKELAFEIEFFIKKHGADISFNPIVAFGANSAVPHHQTSDKRLTTKDKFVLLDFGVKLNNYCSDMTRTVFFGSPTGELRRMYQTVLTAQQLAISRCHAELVSASQINTRSRNKFGMTGKEMDRVARDYIISKGYKTIPHSLGHGIGLEVHEAPHISPKSKDILKAGMVFSIEPGIYIPDFGGVRIEDLIVLEKSGLTRRQAGPRILTHSPRQIIEL